MIKDIDVVKELIDKAAHDPVPTRTLKSLLEKKALSKLQITYLYRKLPLCINVKSTSKEDIHQNEVYARLVLINTLRCFGDVNSLDREHIHDMATRIVCSIKELPLYKRDCTHLPEAVTRYIFREVTKSKRNWFARLLHIFDKEITLDL